MLVREYGPDDDDNDDVASVSDDEYSTPIVGLKAQQGKDIKNQRENQPLI